MMRETFVRHGCYRPRGGPATTYRSLRGSVRTERQQGGSCLLTLANHGMYLVVDQQLGVTVDIDHVRFSTIADRTRLRPARPSIR